ncbi:hypothetical protein LTR62_000717 [Meristemomyces frigidus]|uniref:Uncharacterized protein n=1 Tax=Meristemomyces frigidus TaxID=1508187 RepID=A0AAN7T9V8_9PEZI|nr:hypothetical protein LTR62_000717 [Meristemomyces frigidus]
MKASLLATTLALGNLAAANYISLTNPAAADSLNAGVTEEVSWSVDSDYNLELHLVQQFEYGWSDIDTIFHNQHQDAGEGSYVWVVPNVVDATASKYALWLSGALDNPQGSNNGYANLTDWFTIINMDVNSATAAAGGVKTVGTAAGGAESQKSGPGVGTIVGVSLGLAFNLAIVVAVGVRIVRRRRARKSAQRAEMIEREADIFAADAKRGTARLSFDSIAEEKAKAWEDVSWSKA